MCTGRPAGCLFSPILVLPQLTSAFPLFSNVLSPPPPTPPANSMSPPVYYLEERQLLPHVILAMYSLWYTAAGYIFMKTVLGQRRSIFFSFFCFFFFLTFRRLKATSFKIVSLFLDPLSIRMTSDTWLLPPIPARDPQLERNRKELLQEGK